MLKHQRLGEGQICLSLWLTLSYMAVDIITGHVVVTLLVFNHQFFFDGFPNNVAFVF